MLTIFIISSKGRTMKLYVGVDVSKRKLDVYLNGENLTIDNSSKGILSLINKLKKEPKQGNEVGLVICEASGGYERLLVTTLQKQAFPVHVGHANKIRAFAKAKGFSFDCKLAKQEHCYARIENQSYNVKKYRRIKCQLKSESHLCKYHPKQP